MGRAPIWPWIVLAGGLVAALGLLAMYAWLPADGATGDLGSFGPLGFEVKWLLEDRPGGLRPGDVIVRAGGHTVDEWLGGARRGPEWRRGGVVAYDVLRDSELVMLQIELAPVPLAAIVRRWWLQLATGLASMVVGLILLVRRPREPAAQVLAVTCLTLCLQYWGDGWNFQYALLPWRWPLWLHQTYEYGMYFLTIGSVLLFALLFPRDHPLMRRWPRRVAAGVYLTHPIHVTAAMIVGMGLTRSWSGALSVGNTMSWAIAIVQILAAIAVGARSMRLARDPVSRAQVRWIVWLAMVGAMVLMPGYVVPVALGHPPLVSHPASMVFMALIPWTFAIAILRYRLFDIEVIINRTLVYGTLSVLLAGLYLLLVRFFSLIIPLVLRRQDSAAVIFVSTLGIALAFFPLRRRVQRAIARAFYRTRPDYQRLLPEMSARLATSIELDRIAGLLTDDLPRDLQIAWARLAVVDPGGERLRMVYPNGRPAGGPLDREIDGLAADHPLVKEVVRQVRPIARLRPPPDLGREMQAGMERHGVELCIPLLAGRELAGVYLLGPMQSGDAYPAGEVRLLHLVGQQAAIAIQNGRLFQAEREQRRRAEVLVEEKEVLLKEIHHRVKNNLQVISSLLYLQSRHIQDPATLEMFLESQQRVRSMALIHETLYQADDLTQVNCEDYVRDLASFLCHAYGAVGRVRLCVDVSSVWLGVDAAVPCGLIINELMSNALKHAFPGGGEGEVAIRMVRDNQGRVVLSVTDDGVGLPAELDWQATQSLGLNLVRRLVQQIGGEMEVGSRPAGDLPGAQAAETRPGTAFTVTF